MLSKPVAHIISHTHWDREWYLPYEKHHVRLIALMDTLLDTLEQDAQFRSFHLDGQTIIIEDYLQVRPEKREQLERFIREGRIVIGPWYILQDEFLTSPEANIRNLQIGHADAKKYGVISKLGYFPDSFGNMGQAPQLLQQAGITFAAFGRGVKPTGFNNAVMDSAAYESPFSELIWRAPDGSEVTGILFANWYCNGMEIPVDPEQAKAYWKQKLHDAERFASTDQLLFLNGCDHQPIQTDLSAALETARAAYPDYEFKHSSFEEYVQAFAASLKRPLKEIEGELRSQRTDGWGTLVNTASARVYIKQANVRGQLLLEKGAEPAAVFASQAGLDYPHHLFTYAWKTLMQNHPHDSICGCSVDAVHAEMMTRFAKSYDVADVLLQDSLQHIAARIQTPGSANDDAVSFIVFNQAGVMRSGVVSIELEVKRFPFTPELTPAQLYQQAAEMELPRGAIIDHLGQPAAAEIEDLGAHFNYTLPDDRFRQPYIARRIRVTLHAEQLPALGYRAYAWVPSKEAQNTAAADQHELELSNEYYHIAFAENGSLILTDKTSGNQYTDLCIYENVGDIGNEYVFKQDHSALTLTTKNLKADMRVVSANAFSKTVEIVHHWEIPESADDTLFIEQQSMVPLMNRKAGRSSKLVPLTLRTQVTLEKGVKAVKVKTAFDNKAKDHRLRALFPSDTAAAVHYADSIFEIAKRNNEPAPEWTNPSNAQHQQAFVAIDDERRGLAVANIGLHEYELLRDERNTIAVTLLRAVGELGDWGVFPTPEAQCIGEQQVEFAIIPYADQSARYAAAQEAYAYQIPLYSAQTDVHQQAIDEQQQTLPASESWIKWSSGKQLVLSSVKRNEERGDTLIRWYNLSGETVTLTVDSNSLIGRGSHWFASNVLEERLQPLTADANQQLQITIKPYEIFTLGCGR
ncbi:alpha-mannosidase [Paenibacillus sp. GCM10027626]|uniref:alpha-mannosidase n=1 Tax=Paenibacillus sp. GCM10027626 TaxID=3273411 RepID=UPI00362B5607